MAIYINNSYAFCLLKVVVSNVSVHAKWIHYFLKIMVRGGPLNPLNMCVLEVSLMKKRMPLHGVFYSRCMFLLCFSTQNPFYQNLSTSLKIPNIIYFFFGFLIILIWEYLVLKITLLVFLFFQNPIFFPCKNALEI